MIDRGSLRPDTAARPTFDRRGWVRPDRRADRRDRRGRTGRRGRPGTSAPKPCASSAPRACPAEHVDDVVDRLVARRAHRATPSPCSHPPTASPNPTRCAAPTAPASTRSPAPPATPPAGSWPPSSASSTPPDARGGHRAPTPAVDLALLEAAANGTALNPGQAALVREMATSGAPRPARDRARRVRQDHRHARPRHRLDQRRRHRHRPRPVAPPQPPSSATQIGAHADTLAKLAWALDHRRPLPAWADAHRADEPGDHRRGRHGRHPHPRPRRRARPRPRRQRPAHRRRPATRRDRRRRRPARHRKPPTAPLRLDELVRFTDPAEGAASLALRDGRPRSARLLPRPRPRPRRRPRHHAPTSVFDRLAADRASRPRRDHARPHPRPGRRAQPARPQPTASTAPTPGAEVELADGNRACVGDVDHHPPQRPPAATSAHRLGQERRPLDRHRRPPRRRPRRRSHQTQPADRHPARRLRRRVASNSATPPPSTPPKASPPTPATASLTGDETRQQLYTMLTRGRHANHVYLAGRRRRRPARRHPARGRSSPPTATDLLEAHPRPRRRPHLRHHHRPRAADPATLRLGARRRPLHDAIARRRRTRPPAPTVVAAPRDRPPTELVAGLTDDPAWPTLRAHLLLIAATGTTPSRRSPRSPPGPRAGHRRRPAPPSSTGASTRHRAHPPGPLPWLPGIPTQSRRPPHWGAYLHRRDATRHRTRRQVRHQALATTQPRLGAGGSSAGRRHGRRPHRVAGRHRTPPTDLRPTGERQSQLPTPAGNATSTVASPTTSPPPSPNGPRCSTSSRPPPTGDAYPPSSRNGSRKCRRPASTPTRS